MDWWAIYLVVYLILFFINLFLSYYFIWKPVAQIQQVVTQTASDLEDTATMVNNFISVASPQLARLEAAADLIEGVSEAVRQLYCRLFGNSDPQYCMGLV